MRVRARLLLAAVLAVGPGTPFAETVVDDATVRAHQARQHDVADTVIDCVFVRYPALLHEAALEAELRSDGSHHARVVRLHAAD